MRQDIIDRLVWLADNSVAEIDHAAKSSYDVPSAHLLDDEGNGNGEVTLIIQQEETTGLPDIQSLGHMAPCTLLVPLTSEASDGYVAAYQSGASAAQAAAVALLEAAKCADEDAWRVVERIGPIEVRPVRVRPGMLCASATIVLLVA